MYGKYIGNAKIQAQSLKFDSATLNGSIYQMYLSLLGLYSVDFSKIFSLLIKFYDPMYQLPYNYFTYTQYLPVEFPGSSHTKYEVL